MTQNGSSDVQYMEAERFIYASVNQPIVSPSNGFKTDCSQAAICMIADILSFGSMDINAGEIWIKIQQLPLRKLNLKFRLHNCGYVLFMPHCVKLWLASSSKQKAPNSHFSWNVKYIDCHPPNDNIACNPHNFNSHESQLGGTSSTSCIMQ